MAHYPQTAGSQECMYRLWIQAKNGGRTLKPLEPPETAFDAAKDYDGRRMFWGYHEDSSIGMGVRGPDEVAIWDPEEPERERTFDLEETSREAFLDEVNEFVVG